MSLRRDFPRRPATLVSPATKLAAKRAALRTLLQGYEATLAAGLTANGVLAVVNTVQGRDPVEVTPLIVTGFVAVFGPPLAGLRSWLSITRQGLPGEYVDAARDIPKT